MWDPREDFPLCDEEFSSRQGAETLIHDDEEQRTSPGNTTTPSIISHPRFIFIICLSNVTKTKILQQIPVLNSTRIILDIEEKGSDNQSEEDCHCYLNRFFFKKDTFNHLSQLSMQVHYCLSLRQSCFHRTKRTNITHKLLIKGTWLEVLLSILSVLETSDMH